MSEQRNRYGIPIPGDLARVDPMAPPRVRILPRQAPHAAPCDCMDDLADELSGDLEEGETWREEMSPTETAYWLTEEVIYQIQRLVRQGEHLTMPGLGVVYMYRGELRAVPLREANP